MPVKSLADMDKDNEEQKRQAYYSGGIGNHGGGSGQNVLDPRDLMDKARNELGAGESGSLPAEGEGHTITFWANGFTVDNGPLRKTDDPANKEFLEAVKGGRKPAELVQMDGNATDVDVHLVDKMGQQYSPPPPPAFKAFQGGGQTLSGGAGTASSSAAAAAAGVGAGEPTAPAVDGSKPTTKIQVQLHDGRKIVAEFNSDSHTVGDIQQWVSTATPAVTFQLANTYPRKVLDDLGPTIAAAGLQGAALRQTLT